MSKNILIFSDGTGQAGGLRPDQRLSNVYKLYRATRVGTDSGINPAQQIAFYDVGLGSSEIQGPLWAQIIPAIRKYLSSAFGTGFTNNVADCYEHILGVYAPGDRIYLIGFSRGAYTVRSVAGVLNLCGVPTKGSSGQPIPRWGKALRAIVDEAVHTVYEHGAGHPRADYEDEREELARRFRVKYGAEDDAVENVRGNVAPHFIGVFDTVAALGSSGAKKAGMIAISLIGSSLVAWAVAALLSWLVGWTIWKGLIATAIAALIGFAIFCYRVRIKVIHDFPTKGDMNWHWSAWRFQHYDRYLDPRVRYARHAQAIDETRATFARVGWGRAADHGAAPPDWLIQKWFAGNHSDIGGSYPETESRLSDIALKWMAEEAERCGMIIDWTKLQLWPDPGGMQHSEVIALRERYPSWWPEKWRRSWNEALRDEANEPNSHETVLQRFRLDAVSVCGTMRPYRPENLRKEQALASFYNSAAPRIAVASSKGSNNAS